MTDPGNRGVNSRCGIEVGGYKDFDNVSNKRGKLAGMRRALVERKTTNLYPGQRTDCRRITTLLRHGKMEDIRMRSLLASESQGLMQ